MLRVDKESNYYHTYKGKLFSVLSYLLGRKIQNPIPFQLLAFELVSLRITALNSSLRLSLWDVAIKSVLCWTFLYFENVWILSLDWIR